MLNYKLPIEKKDVNPIIQAEEAAEVAKNIYDSGFLRLIGAAVVLLILLFQKELKKAIVGLFIKKNGTATTFSKLEAASKEDVAIKHHREVSDKNAKDLKSILEKVNEMAEKIEDLREWHDVDDPLQPGVKIWWIPSQLKESLDRLTKAANELNKK